MLFAIIHHTSFSTIHVSAFINKSSHYVLYNFSDGHELYHV